MTTSWIRMGPRSNSLMSLGKERFFSLRTGASPHKHEDREEERCVYKPQDAKRYLKPPETSRGPRVDSPSQPSEEIHHINLDHRLPAFSTIDNNCLFLRFSLWYIVRKPQETNTESLRKTIQEQCEGKSIVLMKQLSYTIIRSVTKYG